MGLGLVDGAVVAIYLLVITIVGVAPSLWPILRRRFRGKPTTLLVGTHTSSDDATLNEDEDSFVEASTGAESLGDFPLTVLKKAPSARVPTQEEGESPGGDDGGEGPVAKDNESDHAGEETEQYFLAGRSVAWWAVGMSLFSSNIGSEHFVGLAGSGAASGLAVGHFEINSPLFILLLGWIFVPYYLDTSVFTMPEFLERRYNRYCRRWLGAVSLAAYVFTKIAVSLYAAAIIFDVVLDIDNQWISAVAILLATSLYTMIGGLRGVVYTEVVQTVVLLVGAVIVLFVGLHEVGGISGLRTRLPDSYFHMIRPASDAEFPWTGIMMGYPVIAFWYWCTDQVIVQRVLAAKSVGHARGGTVLASFFKLLPLFLLVVPGMLARALYGDELAAAPNRAYPLLVVRLMPVGLQGLIVASMLAALMSSFASLFNSCSTIFTMDFYSKWRPNASPRHLVVVGRVATLAMTVLGLLWLPVVPRLSSQLYIYLQSVQGYVAAPITCVFVVGLLWRGANGTGAAVCLTVGSVLGLLRLLAEIVLGRNYNIDIPVLRLVYALFVRSNFLHFTGGLFLTCTGILIAASLVAPSHDEAADSASLPSLWTLLRRSSSTSTETLGDDVPGARWSWWRKKRTHVVAILSCVVVLCVAAILVILR